MIAAVGHDLEHPGTTNAFQVNTGSELARRYNDVSVLENHHCSVCFSLLNQTGLLKPLSDAERLTLRKTVVEAILHTDMSRHKALLQRVEGRVGGGAPPLSRDSAEDRRLLVAFLVHCADLCNPVLAPPMSKRIADRLGDEFKTQARLFPSLPRVRVMLVRQASAPSPTSTDHPLLSLRSATTGEPGAREGPRRHGHAPGDRAAAGGHGNRLHQLCGQASVRRSRAAVAGLADLPGPDRREQADVGGAPAPRAAAIAGVAAGWWGGGPSSHPPSSTAGGAGGVGAAVTTIRRR